MKFRKSTPAAGEAAPDQAKGEGSGPPRWQQAQKDIAALRRRVAALEEELQETRQLNKRLAEIADVVAEVLLPAEQRDENRLQELLSKYESRL